MAFPNNPVDFTIPYTDFLNLQPPGGGGGFWSDVLQTEKQDASPAPAPTIPTNIGALWGNFMDSFAAKVWELNPGNQTSTFTTMNEEIENTLALTLTADGQVGHVRVTVIGAGSNTGEAVFGRLSSAFFRSGGTVTALGGEATVDQNILATTVALVISGDDVNVQVIGEDTKVVNWLVRVEVAESVA